MISEKMQMAFNDQINKELYSAYFYLSMSAYLSSQNLKGMANWMIVQTQEELAHAMAIYNYVLNRGGHVKLGEIASPPSTFASVIDVFESTYEHEKYVSSLINKLADYADEENDRPSASFLKWYIDEQVEEEANTSEILEKVKFISSQPGALFILDREMGLRTFVPPIIG